MVSLVPSVCPLDQDVVTAALTAALSLTHDDAVGKRPDEACACSFQPWVKIYNVSFLADHRMKSGDELPSFHELLATAVAPFPAD